MDTFIEHINKYLETTRLAKSTQKSIIKYTTKFANSFGEEIFKNRTITRNQILEYIQNVENSTKIQTTTRSETRPQANAKSTTLNCIHALNTVIDSNYFSDLGTKHISAYDIKTDINHFPTVIKDVFSTDELRKIRDSEKTVFENLIIQILITTGMRVGGLCNLKINGVYSGKVPLSSGETIEEKGKKKFTFPILEPLHNALIEYEKKNTIFSECSDYYLLSLKNKRICSFKINNIVKEVCNRAEVKGPHVHPHAFRKTVVSRLMSCNTLDHASKYIGHSGTKITSKHYWTTDPSHLVKEMNIPWFCGMDNESNKSSSTLCTEHMIAIGNFIATCEKSIYLASILNQILDEDQLQIIKKMWTDEKKKELSMRTQLALCNIENATTNQIVNASSTLSLN